MYLINDSKSKNQVQTRVALYSSEISLQLVSSLAQDSLFASHPQVLSECVSSPEHTLQ